MGALLDRLLRRPPEDVVPPEAELTVPRDWTVAELRQLRAAAPAFDVDLDSKRAVWRPSPHPRAAEITPIEAEFTQFWAELSARFDDLAHDLAAGFDDAALAVQQRHEKWEYAT